jgi:outer membrane cobalamin receptor
VEVVRGPGSVLYATRGNPYAIGNPDLGPERITIWEAGITYSPVPYIKADLNFFHSKVEDPIGRGGVEPAQYANVLSSVTKGLELGLSGYGKNNLQWKLAYTYQDPRYDLTGSDCPIRHPITPP